MKRIICAVMAVLIVMMCVGCKGQQTQEQEQEQIMELKKESLVGTWKAEADFGESVYEVLSEYEMQDMDFLLSEFPVTIRMTFHEDDTYAISVDADAIQTAVEELTAEIQESLLLMLENELMGWIMELDPDGTGPEMTLEEMLSQNGTSLEEMMGQITDQVEKTGLASKITQTLTQEGQYEISDGQLLLSNSKDVDAGEGLYAVYTLENGELMLEEYVSEDDWLYINIYGLGFQKED